MLATARPTAEGLLSDSMGVTKLITQGAAVNADVIAASLQPATDTGTPLKHMFTHAWRLNKMHCKFCDAVGMNAALQAW